MRVLKVVCLFLVLCCSLSAQLRLNIAGDAKISGQLDLAASGNNLFLGADTGQSITTGQFNTFIGQAAGTFNTEGESNTFIGLLSGYSNTDGEENTFIGAGAGLSNLTGRLNTFLGINAGRSSTGSYNTFLGAKAGYSNSTGIHNTFIGFEAGNDNSTGGENLFLGSGAGRYNQDGQNNAFIGMNAGFQNRTGNDNIFIGRSTGSAGKEGNANTFIGTGAGSLTQLNGEEFYDCTFLGYRADRGGYIDLTNSMALGAQSRISASNSISVGNSAIISIKGQVSFTTFSDSRYKKNVQEDVPGIDFIRHLRPVSYQLDAQGIAAFLGEDQQETTLEGKQKGPTKVSESDRIARDQKSRIRYAGFLAQEVEAAANSIGFEFSGVDKPQNEHSLYGLRYAEFVVPLVKATQEQQLTIEEQQKEIAVLHSEVAALKTMVRQLLAQQPNQTPVQQLDLKRPAGLSQNHPNPFHENTIIDYFLPEGSENARLEVHSVAGKLITSLPLAQTGEGQVQLRAGRFPPGAYLYSLVIDNQVVTSKRMVLTP